MSTGVSSLSFFVKVEGRAHSNYRNPEGIYDVVVQEERSIQHSACAARSVALDQIPFLSENPGAFTVRVFNTLGDEVQIPGNLHTTHEDNGYFRGRSKNHPESVVYQ